MNITKKIARKIIFPTMLGLGVDKIIRNFSQNSILNVMYHGVVLHNSNYFSPRHITKEQFEKHLKYYKKNFDIISIPEAFYKIQNKVKIKRQTITISFDDGFKNNLNTALPLIEKYQTPTTFFVSSLCAKNMTTCCIYTEFIAALNYFYKDEIIKIDAYVFKNQFDSENNISLIDFLKSCPYPERDIIMAKLIEKYDLENKIKSMPEEIWSLLTKDELIQLSHSNMVEIGSHGHLHYNLGLIDSLNAKRELIESKSFLEETIGKGINMIAYPDGSYNENVKNIAQEVGYDYQLAVSYKTPFDSEDKRIMNRYGLSSTTTYESNMIHLNQAFIKSGVIKNS